MFGTYKPEDVEILLKDITGLVEPLPTKEREKRIQSGVHYSEMLPLEYEPSPAYLAAYHDALDRYAPMTAQAVASVAEQIWQDKGADTVDGKRHIPRVFRICKDCHDSQNDDNDP